MPRTAESMNVPGDALHGRGGAPPAAVDISSSLTNSGGVMLWVSGGPGRQGSGGQERPLGMRAESLHVGAPRAL